MTPTELLYIVKIIIVPMWVLMIALPEWKLTHHFIDNRTPTRILFYLFISYLILLLQQVPDFGFGSLYSAIEIISIENGILALKVLFVSWDILIGMWILNKAKESNLSHLLIIPCLITTYYIAPLGFLLFVLVRWISKKSLITSSLT